jgi:hypothetical protein
VIDKRYCLRHVGLVIFYRLIVFCRLVKAMIRKVTILLACCALPIAAYTNDEYEPNDMPAQASEILPNVTQTHTADVEHVGSRSGGNIYERTRSDWLWFSLDEETEVTIIVHGNAFFFNESVGLYSEEVLSDMSIFPIAADNASYIFGSEKAKISERLDPGTYFIDAGPRNNILLPPGGSLKYSVLLEIPLPTPGIYANGWTGAITLTQGSYLVIDVELDVGTYGGKDADWWAAARSPDGWYNHVPPA